MLSVQAADATDEYTYPLPLSPAERYSPPDVEHIGTKPAAGARDTLNDHPEIWEDFRRGPPEGDGINAGPPLLEREAELTLLEHSLDAVAAGAGCVVSIEGAPGIGKTTLLRAAAADARRREMLVLQARGIERERNLAFGIVRQMFEPALRRLDAAARSELLTGAARLAAPVVLADDTAQELAGTDSSLMHGLYWLLANMSERAPVVLAIDDVQWSDAPSLSFLRSIAQRSYDLPVLLAIATRVTEPEARIDDLRIILGEAFALVVPQELSSAAVAQLVRRTLGEPADEEFCDACHRATRGNPLLVHELVNELHQRSISPVAGNSGRVASITSASMSRRVLMRIDRLPEHARTLVEAVSVVGDPADLRMVAAVAGLDEADAGKAVDELVHAGILDAGYPLEFHHPIVRAALYEELDPSSRARLHAEAARLLTAAGDAPERIAMHLLHVPGKADRANVEVLRSAARRSLARGAATTAALILRRALAEPPNVDARPALLHELGRAELRAGELGAVAQLERALDENDDDSARTGIVRDLARAVLMSGDTRRTLALLDEESAAAAGRDEEAHLGLEAESLSITWVERGASGVDPSRVERARRLGGETPAERAVLAAIVPVIAASGDTPASTIADVCKRALGAGRLLAEQTSESPQFVLVAQELAYADELTAAAAHLDDGIADARRSGSALGFFFCSGIRSMVSCRRGEIIDAVAVATQAVDVARQNGWVASFPTGAAMLADALIERGELDSADSVLAEAEPAVEPRTLRAALMVNQLGFRKALVDLARGYVEKAVRKLTELDARKREIGDLNPGRHAWLPSLSIALSRAGESSRARDVVEDALERAQRWGTMSAIGIAMRADALLKSGAARIDRLQEAVTTLAVSPARLEHIRATIDLGAALVAEGKRAAARPILRDALDICDRNGATVLAERARKTLHAAGGRPRRARLTGIASLTPSEQQVARLAASGLSNPAIAQSLFLTVKTIETHLSNAYRKLGIRSREQLPRELLG